MAKKKKKRAKSPTAERASISRKKRSSDGAPKTAATKAPVKKRPGRTAGSDGVNKSAEIRDMLKSRPELKPAVIASLLQQRGVEVTAQYVSMIKSTLKKRSRRSSIASSDKVISLRQLAEVRRLVDKVGGVDQLERILDLIRELQ